MKFSIDLIYMQLYYQLILLNKYIMTYKSLLGKNIPAQLSVKFL